MAALVLVLCFLLELRLGPSEGAVERRADHHTNNGILPCFSREHFSLGERYRFGQDALLYREHRPEGGLPRHGDCGNSSGTAQETPNFDEKVASDNNPPNQRAMSHRLNADTNTVASPGDTAAQLLTMQEEIVQLKASGCGALGHHTIKGSL